MFVGKCESPALIYRLQYSKPSRVSSTPCMGHIPISSSTCATRPHRGRKRAVEIVVVGGGRGSSSSCAARRRAMMSVDAMKSSARQGVVPRRHEFADVHSRRLPPTAMHHGDARARSAARRRELKLRVGEMTPQQEIVAAALQTVLHVVPAHALRVHRRGWWRCCAKFAACVRASCRGVEGRRGGRTSSFRP